MYYFNVNTNGVFIQSNRLVQNGIKQQFIKEGSSLLVRVVADKGNGQYDAYVGGVKTTVTSKTPLQPGTTFVSILHENNGVISLSKNQTVNIEASSNLHILQNQKIAELLESLGLPADEISYNLIQQMKQLEMKFDSTLMNKIRILSLKFKNKEKTAIQLLSILAEKGIEGSIEELLQLIQEYDGDFEGSQKKNHKQNEYKLMNRINNEKGKWYLLPYEIQEFNTKDDDGNYAITGKGCIKVFAPDDKLRMINLDCIYNDDKYLFNLIFDNGLCNQINMNITSKNIDKTYDTEKIIKNLKNKFVKSGKNIEINWSESDLITGTAAAMENIYSFEGVI